MNDGDRGAPPHTGARDDGPERLWSDDDGAVDRPADFTAGLVSLDYIQAALRRGRRFWGGLAVIGSLVGLGLWATLAPGHQASTTLLLTVGPDGQPGTAILNDQTMAQSRGVAGQAVQTLGLRQSVDSFLGTYTATVVTDRILRVTVTAPSSDQAVSRADAVASAFLTFRADQLQTQQNLQFAALDEQLTQSEQRVESLNAQISQVEAQPTSASQQAELGALRTTRDGAQRDLTALKEQVGAAKATAQETTAAMVAQSRVLDAASPLPTPSRLKALILYVGAGLIIGLAIGVGVVIIRALVSDRLRRRDDVAFALGVPVKLSVPSKPASRWRPGRRGLAAAQGQDIQRIVTFLRGVLSRSSRSGALAIVPVDDISVAALSVVSLAVSSAQQDKSVVVADLCSGAPAAKLVGVKDPGVHAVSVDGTHIDVAIPDPNEVAPVGPFGPTSSQAQPTLASQVAAGGASADVLLTLMTLDPSVGSEHLGTWAADAVVVVTAGRSSWTKIHAVGEMVRLAGVHLVSAVLVGADKWDESLGVTVTPEATRDATIVTANGSAERWPPDGAPSSKHMSR
jgi:capsular polysaccharide biosynthesis protein